MPTTVTKSIIPGGGGDYTTIAAYESALPADIVALDELHVGELFGNTVENVSFAGTTTDATRYVVLSGGVKDTDDAFKHSGKQWGAKATIYGTLYQNVATAHLTLQDLAVMSDVGDCISGSGATSVLTIKRCYIYGPASAGAHCIRANTAGGVVNVDSCVVVGGSTINRTIAAGAVMNLRNTLAYGLGSGQGFYAAVGTMNCTNCLSLGEMTTGYFGTITQVNCVAFDTTADGTSPIDSLTEAQWGRVAESDPNLTMLWNGDEETGSLLGKLGRAAVARKRGPLLGTLNGNTISAGQVQCSDDRIGLEFTSPAGQVPGVVGGFVTTVTPDYTGSPAANRHITVLKPGTSTNFNGVTLLHASNGNLILFVYDNAGSVTSTVQVIGWSPVAGTEYKIACAWEGHDGSAGTADAYLSVDGGTPISQTGQTGTRDETDTDGEIYVGGRHTATLGWDGKVRALEIYDVVAPVHRGDITAVSWDTADLPLYEDGAGALEDFNFTPSTIRGLKIDGDSDVADFDADFRLLTVDTEFQPEIGYSRGPQVWVPVQAADVIKTIQESGGDYTTLAAYEAALPADITAASGTNERQIGELRRNTVENLTWSGTLSDDDHYPILCGGAFAASDEFKPRGRLFAAKATVYGSIFLTGVKLELRDLMMVASTNHSGSPNTAGTFNWVRCILIGGSSGFAGFRNSVANATVNADSSIVIGHSNGSRCNHADATINTKNCLIHRALSTGYLESLGTYNITNCIGFDNGAADYNISNGTETSNAASDATADGTDPIDNLTEAQWARKARANLDLVACWNGDEETGLLQGKLGRAALMRKQGALLGSANSNTFSSGLMQCAVARAGLEFTAPAGQVPGVEGSFVIAVTPDYTGAPAGNRNIMYLTPQDGGNNNNVFLRHQSDDTLDIVLYDNAGAAIAATVVDWSPTAGVEYIIACAWKGFDGSAGTGEIYVSVDGGTPGSLTGQTKTRDETDTDGAVWVGGRFAASDGWDGKVRYAEIYNSATPAHRGNLTAIGWNTADLPLEDDLLGALDRFELTLKSMQALKWEGATSGAAEDGAGIPMGSRPCIGVLAGRRQPAML